MNTVTIIGIVIFSISMLISISVDIYKYINIRICKVIKCTSYYIIDANSMQVSYTYDNSEYTSKFKIKKLDYKLISKLSSDKTVYLYVGEKFTTNLEKAPVIEVSIRSDLTNMIVFKHIISIVFGLMCTYLMIKVIL